MLKNRNVNKYISKYDNDFCCQVKMTCFIIIVEVSIMMALGRMCHFLSLGPFFFFFFPSLYLILRINTVQISIKLKGYFIMTENTITFVTGNQNKLEEVIAILSTGQDSEGASKVGKYSINRMSLDLDEVQGTINEVTIHKAKEAAHKIGKPVLVEDTCLGFHALDNLPGPYIKWFLKAVGLEGLNKMLYKFDNKGASAICTFGYCESPESEVKLFQGITNGKIVESRGSQHFGWDSIFEPEGFNLTYGEMNKELKNSISHRSKALAQLRNFLSSQ